MNGPVYRNEFVVVNGDAAGTRIVIPHGNVTIGSEEGSRIRLAASGVSRRHAVVSSLDGRTILTDRASRNGSWVNEEAISSPTELADGDLVQFGSVLLRFHDRNADGGNAGAGNAGGNAGGRQQAAKPAGKHKERLGTALMFAAGINLVGLFGNTLTSFLTDLTPTWTWFVTPVIGLAVALVTETLGHYRKEGGAEQGKGGAEATKGGSGAQPGGSYGPHRQPVRRRPLAVTFLVTLLVLGGGGWLVTAGVSYAVGYFSGNEEGVQRLEGQVATEAQGVTVTILGVQSTPHFTRVEIRVNNGTSSSMSLPLFQNATLTAPDGTTFDADAFRSDWEPRIAPGGVRKGTLNFESQLPDGATTVSLNFVTVFMQGFDGPRSITVPDIPLKALAAG